ncbi:MFS transporter [Plantactinospora sp. B5E13]|uniref:MFS transporter n=1 Tax=Plantactinospora sp. B5E13 TaxID=3153758 RepID=UPI00325EA4F0
MQVTMISSITMVTVALPVLRVQWGLGSSALVLVSTAYSVAFGALLLVAGRAGDRVGHRRLLLGALAMFVVASLAAAVAPGLVVLIAARFVQGVGAAFAVPAAMVLIPAVVPAQRRQRATAVWGVLAVTGAGAGTVASGLVVQWGSWRWLFAAPALVALAAAVVIAQRVPVLPAAGTARTRVATATLLVAGLTALIGGLAVGWLPVTGIGLALLAGFAVTQRRAGGARLWPRLSVSATSGLAAILLAAGAMASLYYLLTLRLAATGHGPAAISLRFLAPATAVLAAGPLAVRLLARYRASRVLGTGLTVAATGLLLVNASLSAPALQPFGLLTFPVGIGVTLSAATVTIMGAATDADRGLLAGVTNTAMEIGPPLVLALVAPLADTHGDRTSILSLTAALALTAPLALLTRPARR